MRTERKKRMNPEQEAVFGHILDGIVSARFPVGERIPSEVELARRLGVGRMNVHRALARLEERRVLFRNKRGGTRVRARPNPFETGELKREVSRCVIVLNPLPEGSAHIHWGPEIRAVLREGLLSRGLGLREEALREFGTPEAFAEKLRALTCAGTAGILAISSQELNPLLTDRPELFFRLHRNFFLYSRDPVRWPDYPYNIVSVDLFDEGIMAAEHVCASGYGRFFFAYSRRESGRNWLAARREGVRCGLMRLVGKCAESVELEEPGALGAALAGGERTAVIAANDRDAVQLGEMLRSAFGKVAGRDYGLVGFDHDASLREHRLTTIAPPLREIGAALAEMIAGVTLGRNDRTSFIRIKSRLIPGESC